MKNHTIKAVLFDMDGTIIDSLKIWDEIIKALVGEPNIKSFRDLRATLPGRGMEQTCFILKYHFNIQKDDAEIVEMHEKIAQQVIHEHKMPFIEGFTAFHHDLEKNGVKTALATNAPNYALNTIREKLNLHLFFKEHIYNSCTVNAFKPDPAILLHTLKQLGVQPSECIIFEDSREGIEAAKRAGISHVVGINSWDNRAELNHTQLIIKNYLNLNYRTLILKLS